MIMSIGKMLKGETMSDYIKREDALKAVDDIVCDAGDAERTCDRIIDLPSEDVAPIRHGRWRSGACSECGGIKPMTRIEDCGLLIWEAPYKLNYCPNCGVKMDGEDKSNCDTCKYYDKWWYAIVCDGCTKEYNYWERKDDE